MSDNPYRSLAPFNMQSSQPQQNNVPKFLSTTSSTSKGINAGPVYRSLAVATSTSTSSTKQQPSLLVQKSKQQQQLKNNGVNSSTNNGSGSGTEGKDERLSVKELNVPLNCYPLCRRHVLSKTLDIKTNEGGHYSQQDICLLNKTLAELKKGIKEVMLGGIPSIKVEIQSEDSNQLVINASHCTSACSYASFVIQIQFVSSKKQFIIEFLRPSGGCPFLMQLLFCRFMSSEIAKKYLEVDSEKALQEAISISERIARCFPSPDSLIQPGTISPPTTMLRSSSN